MNVTHKQEMLIIDFIVIAKLNGASFIEAALPANHHLMVSGNGVQMKQVRKIKTFLACYSDELGNSVSLMVDGFVRQH